MCTYDGVGIAHFLADDDAAAAPAAPVHLTGPGRPQAAVRPTAPGRSRSSGRLVSPSSDANPSRRAPPGVAGREQRLTHRPGRGGSRRGLCSQRVTEHSPFLRRIGRVRSSRSMGQRVRRSCSGWWVIRITGFVAEEPVDAELVADLPVEVAPLPLLQLVDDVPALAETMEPLVQDDRRRRTQ